MSDSKLVVCETGSNIIPIKKVCVVREVDFVNISSKDYDIMLNENVRVFVAVNPKDSRTEKQSFSSEEKVEEK